MEGLLVLASKQQRDTTALAGLDGQLMPLRDVLVNEGTQNQRTIEVEVVLRQVPERMRYRGSRLRLSAS